MDLIVNVIRVPSKKYPTLKKAVTQASAPFAGDKTNRVTTIVVGEGEHIIDGNYLEIPSTMKIVGDPGVPTEEIVVLGSILFEGYNCHLQHMIIRNSCYTTGSCPEGVSGQSSFTMEDVIVEQWVIGVFAEGTGVVGRCTDVEVRQCTWGVTASDGGSVTLIGAKTTVHHNDQGLTIGDDSSEGDSSTIHLVYPLTKEQVSIDNGEWVEWVEGGDPGGNWGTEYDGDINQIKTIDAPAISSTTAPAAAVAPAGETKSNNCVLS